MSSKTMTSAKKPTAKKPTVSSPKTTGGMSARGKALVAAKKNSSKRRIY